MFFDVLPQIENILEQNAKRIGVTPRQAVLLLIINESKDVDLSLYSEDIAHLSKLGLITENNGNNTVTGKGAILAKSYIDKINK